jgi:hypothetical protein
MTQELVIEVDAAAVERSVGNLTRRLAPAGLRVWLRGGARPILRDRIATRFENEGDDAAGKWADLAAATGAFRSRQGFPAFHPINVRTGRLKWFTLLTFRLRSEATGAILSIPGDGDPLSIKKLRMAQRGGVSPKAKRGGGVAIPARPVVALSGVDQRLLFASLKEFLEA